MCLLSNLDDPRHPTTHICLYSSILKVLRLFVFATRRQRLLSASPMMPFLHRKTKQVHLFVCFSPINNKNTIKLLF